MLHDELIAFSEWMTPTAKEHEARQMVIQLIRRAIVQAWPDARVEAFGSQSTQLYMPHGDIDLVVVSDSMENQRREGVLRKMAALLRRHNLATDVQVIARAKVPIVKFVCTYGKLKVDISVNQTNGIHAALYVREWLEECPPLRPLIMAVKLLLSQRGLSEVFSGGLGSYSVICLVISHMQMHPKLQRGEIEASLNLGIMLLDFLELYGKNFGYDNVGISLTGRGSYFRKASKGWRDDRRPFMLSIEDPLDPSNDISKGSFAIGQVRSAFSGAFDILTAALCQRASEIAQKQASRHWGQKDQNDQDEDEQARREIENGVKRAAFQKAENHPQSLLGSIFNVTREMLRHKRDLEELWQGGTLQHRLGRPPPGRSPEPTSFASTPYQSDSHKSAKKTDKNAKKSAKATSTRTTTTTSTKKPQNGETASDPIIIKDDSSSRMRGDADDDDSSVVMMNEEELAASQGFHFSSSSSGDGRAEVDAPEREDGELASDEEEDSRYGSMKRKSGQTSGPSSKRSRLDAFAKHAPKSYVDDHDLSSNDSEVEGTERKGNGVAKKARAQRSNSADIRRSRKHDFWASKGNAVGTGALSPDKEDDESTADVLLNIYD
jgi:non-canonical poly(A) RNA polymerase PAPD5/7